MVRDENGKGRKGKAGEGRGKQTIALIAKPLISLIALGALFLKATPCT